MHPFLAVSLRSVLRGCRVRTGPQVGEHATTFKHKLHVGGRLASLLDSVLLFLAVNLCTRFQLFGFGGSEMDRATAQTLTCLIPSLPPIPCHSAGYSFQGPFKLSMVLLATVPALVAAVYMCGVVVRDRAFYIQLLRKVYMGAYRWGEKGKKEKGGGGSSKCLATEW